MEDKPNINLKFLHNLESGGTGKVILWCMENGLLAKSVKCEVCGNNMALRVRKEITDECMWTCRKANKINPHHKKMSVRKNSIFESVSFNISTVLLLTYMWVNDISHKFICNELNLSHQTVTDWFNFCRTICLEDCISENERIGGLGTEVEIGITQISDLIKRKHLNGRWVVRGIEKASRKSFFRIVDYPTAIEFSAVFKECINPGSVIVADWEQYDWCDDTSFINATSSHGLTFKDLDQKVNNKYRGTWEVILGSLKIKQKTICRDKQDLYLAEYVWKQRHAKNLFLSFLSAIKSAYVLPDRNELAKEVAISSEDLDVSADESGYFLIGEIELGEEVAIPSEVPDVSGNKSANFFPEGIELAEEVVIPLEVDVSTEDSHLDNLSIFDSCKG